MRKIILGVLVAVALSGCAKTYSEKAFSDSQQFMGKPYPQALALAPAFAKNSTFSCEDGLISFCVPYGEPVAAYEASIAAASAAIDRFGKAKNYQTGSSVGGSGYDWSKKNKKAKTITDKSLGYICFSAGNDGKIMGFFDVKKKPLGTLLNSISKKDKLSCGVNSCQSLTGKTFEEFEIFLMSQQWK